MTTTYIWVVEGRIGNKWVPLMGRETRAMVRWLQKNAYDHLKTRIRKYVPA